MLEWYVYRCAWHYHLTKCSVSNIFSLFNNRNVCCFGFQSHDQKEAVWWGGQPAAGSGQCAWTFPQVHGHTPDQTAIWEVTEVHTLTPTHTALGLSIKALFTVASSEPVLCLQLNIPPLVSRTVEKWLQYLDGGILRIASCLCRYSIHTHTHTTPQIQEHRGRKHWTESHYGRDSSIVRD